MTDLFGRLGIQSWCFRHFKSTQQVIDKLKECGLSHLEICGVHGDAAKNDLSDTIRQYRQAGVTLSSCGVYGIGKDEAASRRIFEFARQAGMGAISASLQIEWLPLAEKLAAEYGVRVALHNHGRHDELVNSHFVSRFLSGASANIGLCLDTAWMMDGGDDAVQAAKTFADRLYGVHLKDFIFDRAGKPYDVVLGDGNLDLEALVKHLVAIDYQGYLTLEYEGDVENPIPAIKQCIAKYQGYLDGNLIRLGTESCALCGLFNVEQGGRARCDGCPVRAKTTEQYCYGSPYMKLTELKGIASYKAAESDGELTVTVTDFPELKAPIRAELRFLKSLLPKEI